jgi:uncharacterized membrane protein YqaE (UPF0057 family)
MDMVFGIFLLVCAVFIYLMPSVVAFSKGHRNASAILMLNLLLGWTFLGWVAALVWALTKDLTPPKSSA